jgi:aldehyde:ferredoxin oxidoreductase
MSTYGYNGKVLRVNLSEKITSEEKLDCAIFPRFLGGTGFGAFFLYNEVKSNVEWNHPANRIIIAPGPFSCCRIAGGAACSIVSKGPMTNLAGSSQLNGNFGAYLKSAGYDAIVIHGKAKELTYLFIRNGKAELRTANHLRQKNTFDTEDAIRSELGEKARLSILTIGPAGENLVRFAIISCDKGHIASKNGLGAVLGSKNLKGIAVCLSEKRVPLFDENQVNHLSKELFRNAKNFYKNTLVKWGTNEAFDSYRLNANLPVLNYSTTFFPKNDKFNTKYMRTHYKLKPKPCWACGMQHCNWVKVTEGPYAGYEGEEPEYECVAAWGPLIGNKDMGAVVMLSDLTDKLGMDVNELGWLVAWVMECYEKNLITSSQLDCLEMNWGNVESVRKLLFKIASRSGIGDLLAEGVKRAAEELGGEASKFAVFTMKGNTPRSHDHRSRWFELLDTCVSNTSTIEASGGSIPTERFGMPKVGVSFSPKKVSTSNARINGWFIFLDSLVVCRFCAIDPYLTTSTLNAVTGWNINPEDALLIGKRIVNQLRVFNLLHGLDVSKEKPSDRYASAPPDGPHKDKSIMNYWKKMLQTYYETMGWNKTTGIPNSKTLRDLGLSNLICDLKNFNKGKKNC